MAIDKKVSVSKPSIFTCLSPALLHLYNVSSSIVVIIDILRATSTISTALFNGAKCVIPVDSISECIELGKQMEAITAGERDGQIVEGLSYGNSPLEYSKEFIEGKILVLTTTNGTKLLHMALAEDPIAIITGAFSNLSSVCAFLTKQNKNIIFACAAWKDKVNLEDTLFAGAVINRIKNNFEINCDASHMAETLYVHAQHDLFDFMEKTNASHYHRLMNYGLEEDIRFCLTEDNANTLCIYQDGRLLSASPE